MSQKPAWLFIVLGVLSFQSFGKTLADEEIETFFQMSPQQLATITVSNKTQPLNSCSASDSANQITGSDQPELTTPYADTINKNSAK